MVTPELRLDKELGKVPTRSVTEESRIQAQLMAYYLSRDRVLSLIGMDNLPLSVLGALQGRDVFMSSAILSNAVGKYVIDAIRMEESGR